MRAGRPNSTYTVLVSEGQFLGKMVRALCALRGGLGRLLPCDIGHHLSRLYHFWVGAVFPRSYLQTFRVDSVWVYSGYL